MVTRGRSVWFRRFTPALSTVSNCLITLQRALRAPLLRSCWQRRWKHLSKSHTLFFQLLPCFDGSPASLAPSCCVPLATGPALNICRPSHTVTPSLSTLVLLQRLSRLHCAFAVAPLPTRPSLSSYSQSCNISFLSVPNLESMATLPSPFRCVPLADRAILEDLLSKSHNHNGCPALLTPSCRTPLPTGPSLSTCSQSRIHRSA